MKNRFFRIQIILLAVFFAHSVFGEGGITGNGGGIIKPDQPVDSNDFLNYAMNIPEKLVLVFKFMEPRVRPDQPNSYGLKLSDADAIIQKLFLSRKNIYEVLKVVEVPFPRPDACSDRKKNHRDASAIKTGDTMSICFSYGRLMKKLHQSDYAKRLLALGAHEASHFVGATEKEAKIIEQYVLDNLTGDYAPGVSSGIDGHLFRIYQNGHGFTDALRNLYVGPGVKLTDADAICQFLLPKFTFVDRVIESTSILEGMNLSIFNSFQHGAFLEALVKMDNIRSFCEVSPAGKKIQSALGLPQVSVFQGTEENLHVVEFVNRRKKNPLDDESFSRQQRILSEESLLVLANSTAYIRRVDQGDVAKLRAELSELSVTLIWALELIVPHWDMAKLRKIDWSSKPKSNLLSDWPNKVSNESFR